jgi:hypothetical protein
MKGGSQEVASPTATTQLKMEDACNLCNVIKTFCQKQVTKPKRGRPFGPFKLQMAYPPAYVNIQIPPLLKGGIDQQGVSYNSSILWLEPHQK